MSRYVYDLEDLDETWNEFTSKIGELRDLMYDLENQLDNLDDVYYEDRDSTIVDVVLAYGRQYEELNYYMKDMLETLEKKYNVNYEKNREVETSRTTAFLTFNQWLEKIVRKKEKKMCLDRLET